MYIKELKKNFILKFHHYTAYNFLMRIHLPMVAKQPTVAQRAFAVMEKRETLLSAWYVTRTIMTSSESIEITAQAEEKADQYSIH